MSSTLTTATPDATYTTARKRIEGNLSDRSAYVRARGEEGRYYVTTRPGEHEFHRPGISRVREVVASFMVTVLVLLGVAYFFVGAPVTMEVYGTEDPSLFNLGILLTSFVFAGVLYFVGSLTATWRAASFFRPRTRFSRSIMVDYEALLRRAEARAKGSVTAAAFAQSVGAVRGGLIEVLQDVDALVARTQASRLWHDAEDLEPAGADVARRDELAAQAVDIVATITAATWRSEKVAAQQASQTSERAARKVRDPFVSGQSTSNQEQMRLALERLSELAGLTA